MGSDIPQEAAGSTAQYPKSPTLALSRPQLVQEGLTWTLKQGTPPATPSHLQPQAQFLWLLRMRP